MSSCAIPRPVVSWSGSKYLLSSRILEKFPEEFSTYYEPMVGCGGVFWRVQHAPSVIGDKSRWLMDTYWAIKEDYQKVISILDCLCPSLETYERVREINPYHVDVSFRAAHFIFLTNLSFGGTFRLNKDGKFNVPFGRTTKSKKSIYNKENLRLLSESLQDVILEYGDFEETVKRAGSGDFVYFDPPSPESRVFGYKRDQGVEFREFSSQDYGRLLRTCRSLDERGALWAITDNNTSLMRLHFDKYPVTILTRSKKDNEIEVVLITNYSV